MLTWLNLGSWTYHQSKMARKQFETVTAQGIITTRARLGLSWPLASRSFRMSAVVTSETWNVEHACNFEKWQYSFEFETGCVIALQRKRQEYMFEKHRTSQPKQKSERYSPGLYKISENCASLRHGCGDGLFAAFNF